MASEEGRACPVWEAGSNKAMELPGGGGHDIVVRADFHQKDR